MSGDSLRDALEKLADSWERRPVKEPHSYPEANAYADGQNDTYERSADVLRDLLTDHPAEPDTTERVQPFGLGVSREAIEDAVREALEDLGITAYPTSARNDAEDPLDIECVVGHVAGYIRPVIGGFK